MIIFLLVAQAHLAHASSGSPECPCITSSSSSWSSILAALDAAGAVSTYGTSGCAAHDSNYSLFGCETNAKTFCENPWCFVDMDLCPENRELCEAAGGTLGSTVSPYCRTRNHNPDTFLANITEYYSYETCGSVNDYDLSLLAERVEDRSIRAAADAWAPWIVKRLNLRNEEVWGGPSYDFFTTALTLYDIENEPSVTIIPGWATQESRAKFPESSYTACVHDVAIGNFDICLADLWLTPQRNQLVTFLPAVRQDFFYLVVKKGQNEASMSFMDRVLRPFSPFTLGAWMAVVGFLCIMSLLLWLRDLCDGDTTKSRDCKTLCTTNVLDILKQLFYVWHDFLLSQSSMDVESGPARKIFSLALAFFILVTLASYTASLTSNLVIQSGPASTIDNIGDAIAEGMTICAPAPLLETFSAVYDQAKFVGGDIQQLPRMLHKGDCGCMVLSVDLIDALFAGKVREADCTAYQAGSLTEEEAQCGDEKRDCDFLRVGELLWSVPLSFPIRDDMAHSLSWAFTTAITRGVMADVIDKNIQLFPTSICDAEEDDTESVSMSFDDLSGAMVISFTIMGIGFVVMLVRHYQRQMKAKSEAAETGAQSQAADTKLGAVEAQEEADC